MYFGEKTGAGEFKGTVIFSASLRQQILKETCSEIARNGFKKILLYNGHGGNQDMLSYFSRSVLYEKNDCPPPYDVPNHRHRNGNRAGLLCRYRAGQLLLSRQEAEKEGQEGFQADGTQALLLMPHP